jgi:hypothetical protein
MGIKRCQHDKNKYLCRICCPQAYCEHGIRKSYCKPCGGVSICEHGRQKSHCKPCGGSSFCEHGRVKTTCKQCGGASVCEHGKKKSICKPCGGAYLCEHGVQKSQCKPSICEHDKIKSHCKICSPHAFCEHGRRKLKCKPCGGSSFCEHGRQKSKCKPCGGASVCEHEKQKSQCKICGGSSLCLTEHCKTRVTNKQYKPYCFRCFVFIHPESPLIRNYKTKEYDVRQFIEIVFPEYSWKCDKKVSEGCSSRRPDMFLDLLTHVLCVECDEKQHEPYSCESKRMMELSQDVAHRPIVFIRFNPDAYTNENGIKIRSCWKKNKQGLTSIAHDLDWKIRLQTLQLCIQKHIQIIPEKTITIEQLFFSPPKIEISVSTSLNTS